MAEKRGQPENKPYTCTRPERRSLAGAANPNCKLSLSQVSEIRKRFAVGDANRAELAKEFGVSPSTVGRILSGKNWATTGAEDV